MRRYTEAQLKWIEDNLDAGVFRNQQHFTEVFNALFETDLTVGAMARVLSSRGWSVKTTHNTAHWTEEQNKWLEDMYPEYDCDFVRMADDFNSRFGADKSNCCLAKHLTRMGIHQPRPKSIASKGKRRRSRCPDDAYRNKGMFVKGRKSARGELPIGTIRYNSDGRPFIKVMLSNGDYASGKTKGHNYREPFWKPYSKKIWEDHYGEVPVGYEVCVLSGDLLENDVDKMCIMDRKTKARMAKNGWWDIDNIEIKRFAITLCKLQCLLADSERRRPR